MTRSRAYILILLYVLVISTLGSMLTQAGMGWYRGLELPGFTPPGGVIGLVWTTIYLLSAIAAMLIWNKRKNLRYIRVITVLLLANGVLNVLWSYVFFTAHELGLAIVEMSLLNLTNLGIILLCWNQQRIASVLFIPYLVWVCFATFLAVQIWQLNR